MLTGIEWAIDHDTPWAAPRGRGLLAFEGIEFPHLSALQEFVVLGVDDCKV